MSDLADNDHAWLRHFVLSEEFLLKNWPSACGGYYRYFESRNVVDLLKLRRQRGLSVVRSIFGAGAPAERSNVIVLEQYRRRLRSYDQAR
jgi:hypothetical protein